MVLQSTGVTMASFELRVNTIISQLHTDVSDFNHQNHEHPDWYLQIDPEGYWVTLGITHSPLNDVNAEHAHEVYQKRFKIFKVLESLIETEFSEHTNSDACSFNYEYDSGHMGNRSNFKVVIADYLS